MDALRGYERLNRREAPRRQMYRKPAVIVGARITALLIALFNASDDVFIVLETNYARAPIQLNGLIVAEQRKEPKFDGLLLASAQAGTYFIKLCEAEYGENSVKEDRA